MRLRSKLLLALCALSLFASGCTMIRGSSSPVVDRIRETGKLRVGTAGDYPPLNARSSAGTIIGLDADLAMALALILDVELELVQMPFKELLKAVREHKIDAAISGITMTPQRNMDVMFAGPYFISTKAILGKAETIAKISSVADLDTKVSSVVALKGGTSQTLAKIALTKPKLVFVDSAEEGVQMVRSGKVDAMIADSPIVKFAIVRYPRAGLSSFQIPNSEDPVGIAISTDDPVFLNLVENYVKNLEQIELLPKLREHWFDGDASWIRYLAK
jgi:polar amino acid transport system substrate-binding protein